MLNVYFDGASRGNPGEAGVGILIRSADGDTIFSAAGYAGKMTNNQAEYNALIAALTKLKKIFLSDPARKNQQIIVHSDSELVVKQLNGQYKVKEPELQRLNKIVRELIDAIPAGIEFKHIRREQNRDADRLANAGIDSKIPLAL